jgi:hypothetical protein
MTNPWNPIAVPRTEINILRVSATHPLPLFWGKDARGAFLFVLELPEDAVPDRKHLPELNGLRTMVAKGAGCIRLALVLNDSAEWEIFLALCNDLIRASEKAESSAAAVQIVLRRLQRWREFLKRPRKEAMTDSEIKGLIGELLVLRDPLAAKFGWDEAVSFWKGPENALQDFAVYQTAIEVKCQSGSTTPTIQINSVEQLNAQLPKFYLVVHTLAAAGAKDEGAFTLNTLVRQIREAQADNASDAAHDLFETLLFQTGYIPYEQYDEKFFKLLSTRVYEVREGFPRILPDAIPPGIGHVSYQINLGNLAPFVADLNL